MKRYTDDSMQNSKSQWTQQVHIVSDWKQTNIICKVMRIIHCKNNKLGLKTTSGCIRWHGKHIDISSERMKRPNKIDQVWRGYYIRLTTIIAVVDIS